MFNSVEVIAPEIDDLRSGDKLQSGKWKNWIWKGVVYSSLVYFSSKLCVKSNLCKPILYINTYWHLVYFLFLSHISLSFFVDEILI